MVARAKRLNLHCLDERFRIAQRSLHSADSCEESVMRVDSD